MRTHQQIIQAISSFFGETHNNSRISSIIRDHYDLVYEQLCQSSKANYSNHVKITQPSANATEVDLSVHTNWSSGYPGTAASTVTALGILNNPTWVPDDTDPWEVLPGESRYEVLANTGNRHRFFLDFPKLYFQFYTQDEGDLYVPMYFIGTARTTGNESAGSPIFNAALQALGEQAMIMKCAAQVAISIGDRRERMMLDRSDRAEVDLKNSALKLRRKITTGF